MDDDLFNKLKVLKGSFEERIITSEEYEKQKKEIEKEIEQAKDIRDKSSEADKPVDEPTVEEEKTEKPAKEENKKSKPATYFLKKKQFIIPLAIIILVMALGIYLRVQTSYLPGIDEKAKEIVYETIKSQVREDVNRQHMSAFDIDKESLIDADFKKALQQNKAAVKQLIESEAAILKSNFQDENGQTYLLAVDPYFWLRYADNILKNGHPTGIVRDGMIWDTYIQAPVGYFVGRDMFHPYFIAYLFKVVHFFNKDMYLMRFMFYIPILIMTLAVIPVFFIAKRLSGNFAGFIAATLLVTHQLTLDRTLGGFADTDSYNVLFPLLIVWLFIEIFRSKNKINMFILSLAQGFLIGIYSFTWGGGWWYMFDFILITHIASIMYYFVYNIKKLRKGIVNFLKVPDINKGMIMFLMFILFSGVFVTLFSGFDRFVEAPLNPLSFTRMKTIATESIWPNVFTTIEEQRGIPFDEIKSRMGGILLFISMIGLLFITAKKIKKRDIWFIALSSIWFILIFQMENIFYLLIMLSIPLIIRFIWALANKEIKIDVSIGILLIIWFAATLYASDRGVRWTLLLAPPFAIAAGIALGNIQRYLSNLLTKSMDISRNISILITVLLLSILLVAPLNEANSRARRVIPEIDSVWYASLDKIKKESAQDAIIVSWWDFGHWFKAIGDRAVIFDGASQNTPPAYWVGRALLTSSEKESVEILRMLSCRDSTPSGKYGITCPGEICPLTGVSSLNAVINDAAKSIDILHEIIILNRKNAEKKLSEYSLDDKQIDVVLNHTHCNPPENYFITSDDMIQKSGVWAHFGSWNFDRAQIYNTLNKAEYKKNKQSAMDYLMKRFNYTEKQADDIYYEVQSLSSNKEVNNWIALWPSYAVKPEECTKLSDETFACPIGEGTGLLNTTTMDFYIGTKDGIKHPNPLVYTTKDKIVTKQYDNTIKYGVAVIPTDKGFKSTIMSPELTSSMFTRLFFMDGIGLKHFKKFSDEESVLGNRVIVWKIDWEGNKKKN